MSDPPTSTETANPAASIDDPAFDTVQDALHAGGPRAALEQLAEHLEGCGDYRALLDALLLRARYELELPLVPSGSLSELPEPARTQYEEKYIEALRLVGSKYLDAGDIPSAWAYFRAIGETDRVAQAIRDYQPSGDDERLGAVIEVAFNHGVNPLRGFELILEHYGTCSAITAFEQLPAHDESVRLACAGRLIGRLHEDLSANLRSDIANRGQLLPPVSATIADLIAGRDWLFVDDAYHVDISHLASVVRMSILVVDAVVIALAVDLTEYGRRLSPRLQFEGHPPFERIFDDHGVYLAALLGRDVDAAVAHFRAKLLGYDRESGEAAIAAQTLVNLLVRLGRLDAAIEVASEYLAGLPDAALLCPGVAQLCHRAGDPQRLADISRDHRDLVNYTAALLMIARP
jgi:tetratricopeptide (TPR) repeat protein